MFIFQIMSMMRFRRRYSDAGGESDTAKVMYNETKKGNARRITNEN